MSEPTHDKTAVAELPRLRIHHFFVLTTVFAVVMTFYHLVLPSSEILPAFFDIRVSISAFLQSIAITICGLGMYWLWRGARFFSEVGHWLLLISALGFLYGIATWFAMWGVYRWLGISTHGNFLMSISYVYSFLGIAIYWIAARRSVDSVEWKRFCYSFVLCNILHWCWYGLHLLTNFLWLNVDGELEVARFIASYGFATLWSILCVLAILGDLRSHKSRHWSHWCGVFVWLLQSISSIVWMVVDIM